MTPTRIQNLLDTLSLFGLDAIALNPGPSLTYLTGLKFHLMERPTVLLLSPKAAPVLILPELEKAKLASATTPLTPFFYGDNPATWPEVFRQACQSAALDGLKIGLESTRFRYMELRLLQAALPAASFDTADAAVSELRIRKDADELSAMRRAVEIAQRALTATLPVIKIGVSEREIAAELSQQLLRAGSDAEMPFQPIVSSGPNSANPHASPSERRLQKGDLLVIDWGAAYAGYVSDLTRTFAIGAVEEEYHLIARIVAEANAAGRAAGGPGLAAGIVDQAARAVIEKSGYGVYFTHRTGHGIGLEGHEPPYMFAENGLILAPGMTYTVEPGIYLPDRGGVRIEDNIVITEEGAETLSDLPRELITLDQA